MAATYGLLIQRDPSGDLFVRITREDEVSDAINQMLAEFAAFAGFEGVDIDEPGPVCTAEVFSCGEMHVIWMAWVPGFDDIKLGDELREEDGYLPLAMGRPVTTVTQEDFY